MKTLLARLGLEEQWNALSPRDRLALLGLGGFLACVLIWLLIIAPIQDWRLRADAGYQRSEGDLAWMRANAGRVAAAGTTSSAAQLDSQALLSRVAATARSAELTLSRYQPEGEGVTVELQRQDFNRVIRWLQELRERHGVTVGSLSLTRQENAGYVSGRIRLRA